MYEMFITHSGIKGMKWGIRRWQRLDGTLTPAGKERYGHAPWFVKEARLKRQVMRNNFKSDGDPGSETTKTDVKFIEDGSYREWLNTSDRDRQREIAMKFVNDMAGAKLRDMGYTDSKESREYLAEKDWFQDMLPHMSGYLEVQRYRRGSKT